MNICIPKERRDSEYRVGLTPAGVQLLVSRGHQIFVEHEAGVGSGFPDHAYQEAGGTIVYSGDEVYGRADLILKVAPPTDKEYGWMREETTLMGFLHLSASRTSDVNTLLEKNITAVGYEIIQDSEGELPVLTPLSQLCGRMIPQVAATLAQNNYGGKGFFLGGIPGIPAADVVIVGAGTVGVNAARIFLGMGANVHLLDNSLEVLQAIDREFSSRVNTLVSYPFNLRKVCKFANVLIGSVLVPGAPAPEIITRGMIQTMHSRSIVMDVSIDQGGCVETSRPTNHSNPIFLEEDVIHYCVPNMTGVLGRTATHAMSNATWPFIQQVAELGLGQALEANNSLKQGVYTYRQEIANQALTYALKGRE